jgi:CheY-like chemotaxis protein
MTIAESDILSARILIVDDQEFNVNVLDRILRSVGYSAITTTMDPTQVCALHRENHYGLILLDIEMDSMDGFAVMESLKEIEQDNYLPIIVITSQPDYKLRALQLGAKDFISTPLDRVEVLARAHNLLEVRLLHEESKKHSKALEQKVQEVETSHELIRHQSEEVKLLYDKLVAEQKRSVELSLLPGAMVGVEKEERLATHWIRSLVLRHPWLQINLLTAFIAAAVVGSFQGTIDRLLILTIFLPVLAGQSGNTGSQALAITLRGITVGDLVASKGNALVRKEALLGLLNGALVGLVAALGMFIVATSQDSPNAAMLSVVVFLAMIGSCVVSSICGAIVPLILKRVGADPVTASSIFLTTATDVVSMGMLLGLATVLVK